MSANRPSVENDQRPSVLVTIVNYRVANFTIECLASLAEDRCEDVDLRVVVVDNASGDNSVNEIQAAIVENHWESWVSVIASERNGGYSFGNNLAIRRAVQSESPPAFFFVLNPDTLVQKGTVKTLVNFMQENPNVGIVGPSLEDRGGNAISIAFRFPSMISEFESALQLGFVSKCLSKWVVAKRMGNQAKQVDWVPGGAMLIRREVFESVGLMDEDYFLFYEETDLCLQAKRMGWPCWYVPKARVVDFHGQSRKKTTAGKADRKPQYWFESRRHYFVKNHGVLYAAVADMLWVLGFSLYRIRQRLSKKMDTAPSKFLRDFLSHSVLVKGSAKKRQ